MKMLAPNRLVIPDKFQAMIKIIIGAHMERKPYAYDPPDLFINATSVPKITTKTKILALDVVAILVTNPPLSLYTAVFRASKIFPLE